MNVYQEFVLESQLTLMSTKSEDMSEALIHNIQRALTVFDIDRMTLFPISMAKIGYKDFFSFTRFEHKRLPSDYYMSVDIETYIQKISEGNHWKLYEESDLKNSKILGLRSLAKEGIKFHCSLPVGNFGDIYGGVAISFFSKPDLSEEYKKFFSLLAQIWMLCWREIKLQASLTSLSYSYSEEQAKLELLTPRQLEILKLIGTGISTKQIAEQLNLSLRTIETHKYHIGERLDLDQNDSLTKFIIRNNL